MSEARRTRLIALVLLGLGLAFRLWALPSARFTGDESYFWATARNIATFDASATFGPAMTGSSAFHPSPLFYYLMAVPQRLGVSPYFGGTFIVLLHLAAFLLLFKVVEQSRGSRVALLFLAVGAFAPWDVLYGDRIWLSCVVPFWGAVILRAALSVERPLWQGVLVFFCVTCPAVHMSAPLLWAGVLVMLWYGPKVSWSRSALLLGAVLGALTYAAPLYSELTHDFANTRAILREGGGHEPWDKVVETPFKVFGYAILYGSSEIGYHFGSGYWRPFDDSDTYFTLAGWSEHLRVHGWFFGALNVLSLVLSTYGAKVALDELRRSFLLRSGRALSLDGRLLLGCLVGLSAGALLLVLSTKGYFPHYTLLLMPALLLPAALGLDRLFERQRWLGAISTAALLLAMFASTARYYRTVDARNGVASTWSIVEQLEAEPAPFGLSFEGFHNQFAFEMIANTGFKKSLRIQGGAPVRYRVRNGAVAEPGAPLPPGATLHDRVLLERTPP